MAGKKPAWAKKSKAWQAPKSPKTPRAKKAKLPKPPIPTVGHPTVYVFTVDGQPVPKGRPRFAMVGKGEKKRAMVFTPKSTVDYEQRVREAAARAGVKAAIVGPVSFTLHIFNGDARRRDCDNIEKGIRDALNEIAYLDDTQIRRKSVMVDYDRLNPRAEVIIHSVQLPGLAPELVVLDGDRKGLVRASDDGRFLFRFDGVGAKKGVLSDTDMRPSLDKAWYPMGAVCAYQKHVTLEQAQRLAFVRAKEVHK